jgi:DNA polymerase (family X)
MGTQTRLFPKDKISVIDELPFYDAEKLALSIKTRVEMHCDKLDVVGSIRRKKENIHDVDFVVLVRNEVGWGKIVETLRKAKAIIICSGKAVIKANFPSSGGFFQVDFYRATSTTYGIHKIIRTGSAEHNMWMAQYAASKGFGLKYSQGLIKEGVVVAGEKEEGIFEELGLPYPEPSRRELINGKPLWL